MCATLLRDGYVFLEMLRRCYATRRPNIFVTYSVARRASFTNTLFTIFVAYVQVYKLKLRFMNIYGYISIYL